MPRQLSFVFGLLLYCLDTDYDTDTYTDTDTDTEAQAQHRLSAIKMITVIRFC